MILAKKKPILTTFFLFLALYGMGMCLFGGNAEEEEEDERRTKNAGHTPFPKNVPAEANESPVPKKKKPKTTGKEAAATVLAKEPEVAESTPLIEARQKPAAASEPKTRAQKKKVTQVVAEPAKIVETPKVAKAEPAASPVQAKKKSKKAAPKKPEPKVETPKAVQPESQSESDSSDVQIVEKPKKGKKQVAKTTPNVEIKKA